MLAVTKYPQGFVESCRKKVKGHVAAYKKVATPARKHAGTKGPLESFEPVFFNNMVLVLESFFMHRLRNAEGKDGNPANEVRLVAKSLIENDGKLLADKQIKLDKATSVLKLEPGDEISLSEADFVRLSDAFFAEIAKRFG